MKLNFNRRHGKADDAFQTKAGVRGSTQECWKGVGIDKSGQCTVPFVSLVLVRWQAMVCPAKDSLLLESNA